MIRSSSGQSGIVQRNDLALDPAELELLPGQVALGAVQQRQQLPMIARDAGESQPRALPELVMVDLRDRGAEPLLQLRLRRLDVLSLALERARLREMKLDREDSDVAGAHTSYCPRAD